MNNKFPKLAAGMDLIHGEEAYKVQARANELEAAGRSIIRMEIGQPDILPPEYIITSTIDALKAGKVRYTSPLGLPELRSAVAKHVSETRGVRVTPEMVGITPSTKTGIFLGMAAVLEKGDEVICPDPGYPTYEDGINFFGAVPRQLPFTEKNKFDLDSDALRAIVNEKTKLIILNSPSNPLGGIISKEALAQIPRILEERGASPWIISDEIYSRFVYDGAERAPSIYSVPGMSDRTFLLDGFSKIY